MSTQTANVHRFGDSIAVSVGDGSTVYLTPAMARTLSKALLKAAQSVKREKFTDSPGGLTVSVDIGEQDNTAGNPRYATIERRAL